jgi:hypothetical protein
MHVVIYQLGMDILTPLIDHKIFLLIIIGAHLRSKLRLLAELTSDLIWLRRGVVKLLVLKGTEICGLEADRRRDLLTIF